MMRRPNALALVALALTALVSAMVAAPMGGTTSSDCRIALADDADVPAHQLTQPGEQIEATYTAQAVLGDWTVDTNVAAEHGRIQGRAPDVELTEGEEREIVVRVTIGDVPEGTYSIGIFSSATCTSADGSERTTYSFEVTVAPTRPGDLSDPRGDHFARADRRSVTTTEAVDLTRVEASLDGASVRFRMSVADAVPSLGDDAPLRMGCYLDTVGSATLLEPFDPRGFERLARVSWHPDEARTRVTDNRDEPTTDPLNVRVNDERDALQMTIAGLDVDETSAWLCFAETDTGQHLLVDVVPNHGGPYRGWLSD